MTNSLPDKKIIEQFSRYDGNLVLLSFGPFGDCKLLAQGLNLFDALALMTRENLEFRTVRILVNPPAGVEQIRTLDDLNLSPIFSNYVWLPDRNEFKPKVKEVAGESYPL